MQIEAATVCAWLRGRLRRQAWLNTLGGIGSLLASAVVLLITLGLVYCTLLVAFRWAIPLKADTTRLWVSLAVLGFLFVANALVRREELCEYSITTWNEEEPCSFYLPGAGLASNVVLFAPNTLVSTARMLLDLGTAGPRLTATGLRAFRQAWRLGQFDVQGCGAVLAILLGEQGRVSFQDLYNRLGWINPVTLFPQVVTIDGVVLLQKEPAGLTLTPEFRQEFRDDAAQQGLVPA